MKENPSNYILLNLLLANYDRKTMMFIFPATAFTVVDLQPKGIKLIETYGANMKIMVPSPALMSSIHLD